MLKRTSENGILNNAQNANVTSIYYSALEKVKLAYMAIKTEIMTQTVADSKYNAQSKGRELTAIVVEELKGTEWKVKEYNNIRNVIEIIYSNSSLKKESVAMGKPIYDGKIEFEIRLSGQEVELYLDGAMVGSNGYNGEKIPVTKLHEGDEVNYTDANGNTIPCIVLYDSAHNEGIQIITKDLVKDSDGNDVIIELGNGKSRTNSRSADATLFETAKESYNTAIAKLNTVANTYKNSDLAISARCVGSSPNEEPIILENNTGTYTNIYDYFSSPINFNSQFKDADSNVSEKKGDYAQMKKEKINCNNISKTYWLASRAIGSNKNWTDFFILDVNASRIISIFQLG